MAERRKDKASADERGTTGGEPGGRAARWRALSAGLGIEGEIRHIDQYVGTWAIEERRGRAMAQRIDAMDLGRHVAERRERRGGERPDAQAQDGPYCWSDGWNQHTVLDVQPGGVAHVEIVGVMTKYGSSMGEPHGCVRLTRAIRHAMTDPAVASMVMSIDSPGGMVFGTKDLADAVHAFARVKPVIAVIPDLAASAAYWVASQATSIVAGASALVGSIGTYMVVEDWSEAAKKMGVTVHVVRAGAFKGAGTPGTEVTDAHLADFQREVDGLNGFFIDGVARGRGMDRATVDALADGRAHLASAAMGLGLVDSIGTLESVVASLSDPAATQELDGMFGKKGKTNGNGDAGAQRTGNARSEDGEDDEDGPTDPPPGMSDQEMRDWLRENRPGVLDAADGDGEDEDGEDGEGGEGGGGGGEDEPMGAASLRELRAIDGADGDFCLMALDQGLSVAQATAVLADRTAAATAERHRALGQGAEPIAEPTPKGTNTAAESGRSGEVARAFPDASAVADADNFERMWASDAKLRAAVEQRDRTKSWWMNFARATAHAGGDPLVELMDLG